jgi:glutathione S-transferase
VGYWSIRGLAAAIRMMLCAAGVNHVSYMYDLKESADNNQWTSDYFTEKAENLIQFNSFMNLPYIVDHSEKLVLTQTNACLQSVGECLGMMGGANKVEHAVCVQLLSELYDLRNVMVRYAYDAQQQDAAESTLNEAQKYFAKFNAHLASSSSSNAHLVGDGFTAPDFHLFELVDQFVHLAKAKNLPDCLMNHPHVRAFYTEFAQLK